MNSIVDYNQQLPPLILDFDQSVLKLTPDEYRINLTSWQDRIRFGSTLRDFRELENHLKKELPSTFSCAFIGSGDYHHITLILLKHLIETTKPRKNSLDILVLDNHPDNMRYPFGIHCGSWVRRASELDQVRTIHVIGISSNDIGLAHSWENYLTPLLSKKLHYWSVGDINSSWIKWLGRKEQLHNYPNCQTMVSDLKLTVEQLSKIYLSIDKDVFAPEHIKTNWDQGSMSPVDLECLLDACKGKIVGADITGEYSSYSYKSLFKRLLTRLDGQKEEERSDNILLYQKDQLNLNLRLLEQIKKNWCKE